ncbi:MAG: radical SAM protein [Candidatus Omnitrophica bacterium]|nr:radical SAM protein [Candidatus Omnitrophota bacterium]
MENKINLINRIITPLFDKLMNCNICPRNCHVNRLNDDIGYCGAKNDVVVYTSFLHTGEEPAICGNGGSGTIFFSGCSLKCEYCQNYKFSNSIVGKKLSENELAQTMLNLQNRGSDNINLVTPTHYLPQILKSLLIALKYGLNIPIIYNTSGYEKKEIIRQLNGIIDIYLTDFKYISDDSAKLYSKAPDYPKFCKESIKSMSRPSLWNNSNNLLKKGLIIRHLVLPGQINESMAILKWIKNNVPDAITSIMFQYQPYYNSSKYSEINRKINKQEYNIIKNLSEKLELNGWIQDFKPEEKLAGIYFKPEL